MSLFTTIFAPLVSVFFLIIIPGCCLGLLFLKDRTLSLADMFFCGWGLVVCVSVVLLFFTKDTHQLVFSLRCVIGIFSIGSLGYYFFREVHSVEKLFEYIWKAPKFYSASIAFLVLALAGVMVVTHPYGYDDYSHLSLLVKSLSSDIFQDYRNFVDLKHGWFDEIWLIARYPFWSLLICYLGEGITGGILGVYYWLGIIVLTTSLVKIFEISHLRSGSQLTAITITSLSAMILAVLGPDSYFNFGIYPLQQGKLLFLVGVLYIFNNSASSENKSYIFLGAILLTISWLHHLNLALLYAFIAPLALLLVCIKTGNWKNRFQYLCAFCVLPMVVFSLIASGNGFVRIETKVQKVEVKSAPRQSEAQGFNRHKGTIQNIKSVTQKDNPSTVLHRLLTMPYHWFKIGKYVSVYLLRVFSPELLLIAVLVFIAPLFSILQRLRVLVCIGALIIVFGSSIIILPRQAVASFYKPGVLWMCLDLRDFKSLIGDGEKIATEPYTGLYLKLLYDLDVKILPLWSQLQVFYPFFLVPSGGSGERIVFNRRYWGNSIGNPVVEGFTQNITEDIYSWLEEGRISKIDDILNDCYLLFKTQLKGSVTLLNSPNNINVGNVPQEKSTLTNKKSIRIFRDATFIHFTNVAINEKIIMRFNYTGDGVELVAFSHGDYGDLTDFVETLVRVTNENDKQPVKIKVKQYFEQDSHVKFIHANNMDKYGQVEIVLQSKENLKNLQLVFRVIGYGAYKQIGEMKNVRYVTKKE